MDVLQVRFILAVVEGRLVVSNRKKADLLQELARCVTYCGFDSAGLRQTFILRCSMHGSYSRTSLSFLEIIRF